MGGPTPATLELTISRTGTRMHLSGPVLRSRVLAFAAALPQFGDGLQEALPTPLPAETPEAPIRIDLQSTRPWRGPQIWTPVAPPPPPPKRRRIPPMNQCSLENVPDT